MNLISKVKYKRNKWQLFRVKYLNTMILLFVTRQNLTILKLMYALCRMKMCAKYSTDCIMPTIEPNVQVSDTTNV